MMSVEKRTYERKMLSAAMQFKDSDPDYLEVRDVPSCPGEKGVFLTEPIAKGEYICSYRGGPVTADPGLSHNNEANAFIFTAEVGKF